MNRANIFTEAYDQLHGMSVAEINRPFEINFRDEDGIDAGGVTRDFFIELSKAMFNPDYTLFKLGDNGVNFHPNPNSYN